MSEWRNPQSMLSRSSSASKVLVFGRKLLLRPSALPTCVVPSMMSTISEASQNSMSEDPLSLMTDDGQDRPVSTAEVSNPAFPINGPRVVISRGARVFAVRSPPGAVIIHTSKLARTLFGQRNPTKHHHYHRSRMGRRTVMRMEFENGVKPVKRNVFAQKPWLDGLNVMAIVAGNTVTSILVAWTVAILYAVGSPFAPVSPEILIMGVTTMAKDSVMPVADTTQFFGAMGFYFVLFACIAHAVPVAVALSQRGIVAQGIFRSLARALNATWYVLLICLAAGAGAMALLAAHRVPCRDYGRVHLYVMCTIAYGYVIFTERKMCESKENSNKTLRPPTRLWHTTTTTSGTDAVVPIARAVERNADAATGPRRPAHLTAKSLRQLPRAMRDGFLHLVSFNIVFAYLHTASALKLTGGWELLALAMVSLLLKLALQESTKRFQLHHATVNRSSVRAVHVAMTIPTLAIDAQIRMVFMQNGVGQSIVVSSIAIVSCEVFFRVAKILRLRCLITARLAECKNMQRILKRVNSKSALRDIAIARAEYTGFLDWKNFVLRVHAAEVFADMHAEHISIGMSTAVVVCMGDHPMFDLARIQMHNDSAGQLVLAATFQMGTGLTSDYVSSVVEGVHEVSLYDSIAAEGAGLRALLHVLLSALTAVNIGIIGVFYVRSF